MSCFKLYVVIDFSFIPFLAQGDITGDQVVNILDVVALVQYILDLTELDEFQLIAADLNEDGIINILDVVQLIELILGT